MLLKAKHLYIYILCIHTKQATYHLLVYLYINNFNFLM